jgi:hypothetical protein
MTHTPRLIFSAIILWLLTSTGALMVGCASSSLSNSFSSPEELAQAVLDALAAKDEDALWALIVTPEEHRELLWDQLPESKTYSFEYVREWSERDSRKGLHNALERFGGTQFELTKVEFTEGSEEYDDFTVFFGTKLHVRRVSDGQTGTLPILDVTVVCDGTWKLMNYEE